MSIFGRIFGGPLGTETIDLEDSAVCMHGVLTPRWESIDEMGQEQKISGYKCQSCREEFEPDEAYWLWLRAVDRLRDLKGSLTEN
jgi:hypothetical protein